MNKEQAIKYLQNVLDKWVTFNQDHKQLAIAIKVLLAENKALEKSNRNWRRKVQRLREANRK